LFLFPDPNFRLISDAKKEKEKFVSNFAEGFKQLWDSKEYSDFIVAAGAVDDPTEFKVHKCLLAVHSSVFAAVFQSDETGKLFIEDFGIETVKEFLEFLYNGEVPREENAMELFAIAARYKVSQLKEICEMAVLRNINDSNAIEVFVLGHSFSSEELKKASFEAIKKMFPELKLQDSLMDTPEKLNALYEARRIRDSKKQEADAEYQAKVDSLEL
jgi:BTB/POZ domain